jgi:hypothetical protein
MPDLHQQITPEITIADITRATLLASIQTPGKEIFPVIKFIPLVVSNLFPDAACGVNRRLIEVD